VTHQSKGKTRKYCINIPFDLYAQMSRSHNVFSVMKHYSKKARSQAVFAGFYKQSVQKTLTDLPNISAGEK
jgi:hypothetical protein